MASIQHAAAQGQQHEVDTYTACLKLVQIGTRCTDIKNKSQDSVPTSCRSSELASTRLHAVANRLTFLPACIPPQSVLMGVGVRPHSGAILAVAYTYIHSPALWGCQAVGCIVGRGARLLFDHINLLPLATLFLYILVCTIT